MMKGASVCKMLRAGLGSGKGCVMLTWIKVTTAVCKLWQCHPLSRWQRTFSVCPPSPGVDVASFRLTLSTQHSGLWILGLSLYHPFPRGHILVGEASATLMASASLASPGWGPSRLWEALLRFPKVSGSPGRSVCSWACWTTEVRAGGLRTSERVGPSTLASSLITGSSPSLLAHASWPCPPPAASPAPSILSGFPQPHTGPHFLG